MESRDKPWQCKNLLSLLHTFIAIVLLLTISCAAPGPKPTASLDEVMAKESVAQQSNKELNDQLFAAAASAPQTGDYIIGEGDLLQVTVFEAEELSREARVGARGAVTLPLVGAVEVQGLTTREAEQRIQDAYQQRYIQNPHVNIFVKEQHGSKITLLGQLEKPGTYDYFGSKHLLDVLAMAGGLKEEAGRTVQVRRAGAESDQPATFMVDLDELVKKGRTELNVPIFGGDVIFVPEAGTVYVDGAVVKSGAYPIKQDMSIQEAIVAAGGFSPAASDTIKLVRHTDAGARDVIELSAKNVATGGLGVQDRDIIFVETNPLKAAAYGLRIQLFGTGVAISPPK
ncbi:MAG: polysaccharide biosynthesis/export family protein [Desulforhabdus sp.]|nr:polysaccharide biosynthesis/export family protein [Desulforhabdus sp.]